MASGKITGRYRYQVVAGASVWGGLSPIREARQRACSLRAAYPQAEVERVLELPMNARRYWRWRSGRWSLRDHYDPAPGDLERWSS